VQGADVVENAAIAWLQQQINHGWTLFDPLLEGTGEFEHVVVSRFGGARQIYGVSKPTDAERITPVQDGLPDDAAAELVGNTPWQWLVLESRDQVIIPPRQFIH
jgi:hypothetical protein